MEQKKHQNLSNSYTNPVLESRRQEALAYLKAENKWLPETDTPWTPFPTVLIKDWQV